MRLSKTLHIFKVNIQGKDKDDNRPYEKDFMVIAIDTESATNFAKATVHKDIIIIQTAAKAVGQAYYFMDAGIY